jgi:hypothetical protein
MASVRTPLPPGCPNRPWRPQRRRALAFDPAIAFDRRRPINVGGRRWDGVSYASPSTLRRGSIGRGASRVPRARYGTAHPAGARHRPRTGAPCQTVRYAEPGLAAPRHREPQTAAARRRVARPTPAGGRAQRGEPALMEAEDLLRQCRGLLHPQVKRAVRARPQAGTPHSSVKRSSVSAGSGPTNRQPLPENIGKARARFEKNSVMRSEDTKAWFVPQVSAQT